MPLASSPCIHIVEALCASTAEQQRRHHPAIYPLVIAPFSLPLTDASLHRAWRSKSAAPSLLIRRITLVEVQDVSAHLESCARPHYPLSHFSRVYWPASCMELSSITDILSMLSNLAQVPGNPRAKCRKHGFDRVRIPRLDGDLRFRRP